MKVLQINAVYGFKSTGIIVKDIGEMLAANGDQAYFAYQSVSSQSPMNGYRIGNKLDWKLHALYARIFGKQAYASKRATKKLLKWIDSISPDVVHLHNLHSNYINLNLLCEYLAEKQIKTVITLHDCWFFTGKCSHYVAVRCDKWQESCGKCPLNKSEVPSLFFDNTSRVLKEKTDSLNKIQDLTIVGCSNWICGQAKKSLLRPNRIETVYNGVDVSVFKPHENDFRKLHDLEEKFVILGMADKWYNAQNREIVERLIAEQNDGTKIVIVGCKEEQKKHFSKFDNVLAVGYVSNRKELSDIYASANVFVNLTRADTLPTVNMESICCGTPVITFDCCGSPELIDSDSGFVVEEGDVNAVLEKIEWLKQNNLELDIQQKHKKFDKNICYEKYLEIYKD